MGHGASRAGAASIRAARNSYRNCEPADMNACAAARTQVEDDDSRAAGRHVRRHLSVRAVVQVQRGALRRGQAALQARARGVQGRRLHVVRVHGAAGPHRSRKVLGIVAVACAGSNASVSNNWSPA